MAAQIIGNKPNTYTFTKVPREALKYTDPTAILSGPWRVPALITEGGSLPIVIIRPSIVVAAWREPLPGWLENLNGPTGIVAGEGKGVLRTVYCK
jgi:fatty acyl-CoA reductase